MIMDRKLFKLKKVKQIINKIKMRNFIIKKEILLMKILKIKVKIHILKISSIQIQNIQKKINNIYDKIMKF